MTNRFMVSVAALALIAGTAGFANAQGTSKEPGGAGGAAMQHSAPSDTSAAPSQSPSSTGTSKSEANEPSKAGEPSKGGMKSTQTEQKPGAMKNERAEDNNVKGGSTKERAEDRGKGANENQRAEDKSGNMKEGRDNNMKAEGRQDKSGASTAETKTERSQTTGQAGAGAKLTTDQRTKITTVIRNEHAAPVTNVNFSIAVGTRVPREGVSFRPLPTEVVTIYPEWRGYEYILVRNQILVIDPGTYEIVAILDV
jgi:hypothetical protein